jgi:serine phosphatase RsbU (regulator of sigma subunit)
VEKPMALTTFSRSILTTHSRNYVLVAKLFIVIAFLSAKCGQALRLLQQPIGVDEYFKPFTNHTFTLNRNDIIYLFTDGFADQFGGSDNKIFMYSRLRKLLTELCNTPMDQQKIILEFAFETWKGKNEQTDDVLLIGIKI